MNHQPNDEETRRQRRRQKMIEAKRKKRRQMMIRKLVRLAALPVAALLLIGVLVFAGKAMFHSPAEEENTESKIQNNVEDETENMAEIVTVDTQPVREDKIEEEVIQEKVYEPYSTAETRQIGGDVISGYAVVIDAKTGEILAKKNENSRMNPASMTKVLTVLVAAEQIKNLEDSFTITREITDYSYVNDCSNVGFEENETVSVRDLFFGTILSSGADAAAGLAIYTAGSLEAFTNLMNEKLKDLGISETSNFTNCVGIYDENLYSTVSDMAVIMQAAVENELCREIMSARTYTTSKTIQHPEGLLISNWFLRRIEDKDAGGEVICGKTGYVVQSGNCAASYAEDEAGNGYICVTGDASSGWRCIYDHVDLYKEFLQ